MQASLKLPKTVRAEDIANILLLRKTVEAVKSKFESLEQVLNKAEQSVIAAIENGAQVLVDREVAVRTVERRFPHWKAHFAEVAGAQAAEEVLRNTPPSIYKNLVIK